MDLPKLDMQAAGLDWINDPEQAKSAAAHDWQNALAVVIHYRILLQALMADALQAEAEDDAKRINILLRQLKETGSLIQSMLTSLRH